MLTHARLLALVRYDPETGAFTAKAGRPDVEAGKRLGSITGKGYLHLSIDGRLYLLHRLAWFYMTGRWPPKVDHRNRRKADNRWVNLREATQAQNRMNSGARKDNVAGLKGVGARANGRFQATINKDGKRTHLGYFSTAEEAHAAYVRAAKATYGQFAEHL